MTRQFVTFYLGDRQLGVEASQVREVLRGGEITSVPLSPDSVAGLINLRGKIITAIDLRGRLGLPASDRDSHVNVVVGSEEEPVSLVVDAVGDVVDVDEDLFETPPPTASDETRELILGAYKLEGSLLLELDLDRVLGSEEVGSIDV